MKKLLLCAFCCLFLTGCGSYRELNDVVIVSGGGLKQGENGEIDLTSQLVTLPEGEMTPQPELAAVSGQTPSAAFDALHKLTGKAPYWSHAQSFLIGENLARTGVTQTIQALVADPEIRLTDRLLVTAGTQPEPVLSATAAAGEISGYDLYTLVSSPTAQLDMPLYRFADTLFDTGIDPILPAVTLTADGKPALLGTAIFHGDALAGYLNYDQTQTLILLLGKIQSMPLTLKTGETYLLDHAFCRMVPARQEDHLVFTVHLTVQARQKDGDGSSRQLQAELDKRITTLFSILRDDLQADSLGVIRQAQRYLPAAEIPKNPYPTAQLKTQISVSLSPTSSVTQTQEVNAHG